jgi:hypothetical protein
VPLIPAHHPVYGTCLIPDSWLRLHPGEWTVALDPAEHTAAAVIAHLRRSGPDERDRVLALERAAARPRKTVLALASTPTPVAVGAGSRTTPAAGDVPAETLED